MALDDRTKNAINEAAVTEGMTPIESEAAVLDALLVQQQKEAQGFDIDGFMAEFQPAETFLVYLPNGQTWEFRSWESLEEKRKWEKQAARWYAELPKHGTPEADKHALGKVLPNSGYEAMCAKLIADRCVHPKIPVAAALRMNKAAEVMASIQRQIEEGNKSAWTIALAKVTELQGKGSGGTGSTASA